MNVHSLAMLNGWEIILVLAVLILLFGAKKLPEFAKGLGQSIKEFKASSREEAKPAERLSERQS